MPNEPVAVQEDITANESVISLKNGPVILPQTRLSLWAVILTLLGALALFALLLTDLIYTGFFYRDMHKFLESIIRTPFVFERIETFIFVITSILLFRVRTTGRSLKTISLFIIAAVLLRAMMYLNGIIYEPFGFFKCYYLIAGISPVIAGLFIVLYTFNAIRKIPSLIIIGIMLGLFFFIEIFMNLRQIWLSLDTPFHIGLDMIIYELRHLYFLFFPPGIFLTVLASKQKTV